MTIITEIEVKREGPMALFRSALRGNWLVTCRDCRYRRWHMDQMDAVDDFYDHDHSEGG